MYGLTLNLFGVVGRKAASVRGSSIRRSAEVGIVWDEAIIDKFITAPKKLFPGTRMELPGVEDVKTRTALFVICLVLRSSARSGTFLSAPSLGRSAKLKIAHAWRQIWSRAVVPH